MGVCGGRAGYILYVHVAIGWLQHKDFVDDQVEKFMTFSYGQAKGKNTDKQGLQCTYDA